MYLEHARRAKEAAEKRCVDNVGNMHRVGMPYFTVLKYCTPVACTLMKAARNTFPNMGGTCVSWVAHVYHVLNALPYCFRT